MPTAASIRTRWPEAFPTEWDVGDSILNAAIAEALLWVRSPDVWGGLYELATTYFAAHIAALNRGITAVDSGGVGSTTIAGPITSMAAGGVSVSFADAGTAGGVSAGQAGDLLSSTMFGQLYLGLLRQQPGFRIVVL